MANKFKGEKSFKIGTKTHKLLLNLNASAEIEDMVDQSYSFFLNEHFLEGIPRIKPSIVIFICCYMEANKCDEKKAREVAEKYYQSSGVQSLENLVLDLVVSQMTLGRKEKTSGVEEDTEGN